MLNLAELISYEEMDEANPSFRKIKIKLLPENSLSFAYIPLTENNQFLPKIGSIILIFQPNDFIAYYITTIKDPLYSFTPHDYALLTDKKYALNEGDFCFKKDDTMLLIKTSSALLQSDTSSFLLSPNYSILSTPGKITLQGSSIDIFSEISQLTIPTQHIKLSFNIKNIVNSDLLINSNGVTIKCNFSGKETSIKIDNSGCIIQNGMSTIKVKMNEIEISGKDIKLGKNTKKLLTESFIDFFNNHTHNGFPLDIKITNKEMFLTQKVVGE